MVQHVVVYTGVVELPLLLQLLGDDVGLRPLQPDDDAACARQPYVAHDSFDIVLFRDV